jgi:hypothetical protein
MSASAAGRVACRNGVLRSTPGVPRARSSGRAASAPSSKSDSQGSFQVTDTHKETGELAREWIADVFENVDYERVMSSADAFEASGEYIKQEDEDEELRYGEFDMGFFVAVVEACEPLLEGDGGDDGDPGAFVDVGSGRGQIPVLAAALRPWSRCTGLEYMPVLHAIAEQAPGLRDEFARAMDESRKQSLRNALGPRFDSPAPLTFTRGDMYDPHTLNNATKGAALVFMFSTKFSVDETSRCLKVSKALREALRVGAVAVTVNNVLDEADGFALLTQLNGPDSERAGGSTAYIWRAV